MDELAHRFDFLNILLEKGNLVSDTAFPQLVDPESQLGDCGKRYRAKEVAMRVNNESIMWRCRRMKSTLFDEVRVDNGVISESIR